MQSKLKSYQITEYIIKKAAIGEYYCKYIELYFTADYIGQGYPAIKLKDLDEGIKYFNETMNVNDMKDAEGKKVWAIASNCDIFGFINPENSKIFSLQAHFFPEQYDKDIEQLINEGQHNLKDYSKHNALLVALLSNAYITEDNEEITHKVKHLIDSYSLETRLKNELSEKEENNILRVKI